MAKWYKISTYGINPEITAIEVIKETKEFVTYVDTFWKKERRSRKGDEFFSTFAEARTALLNIYQFRMDSAKNEHAAARKKWEHAFDMEAPVEN